MLTHPTIDQLRELKLDGMADAFIELESQDRARELSHAEWLALLLDREAASRSTRRFETRLRAAHLRHGQASVEDVDYRTPRKLDKALFQQLATCRWIVEHRNVLVTGPCGVGKSWLSCALAQKACRDGYSVHYARVPRLFADLELAHGDGRFARLFRTLTKVDLLILDDWGPDRLTAVQRRDPMDFVEDPRVHGRCLKRTKSLVGLNGPPGECPVVAKVWVLCHLIAVLLTEAQLSAIGDSPRRGPVLGRTCGGSTAS